MTSVAKNIAIIGAGISGANLASKLVQAGFNVEVFEKARGPGGRTSTRRVELEGKSYFIDHGAQYIDTEASFINDFLDLGLVKKLETHKDKYVVVPNMNSLVKHLFQGIRAKYSTRVSKIEHKEGKNTLFDEDGNTLGDYDLVLTTAPPKQSYELLKDFSEFSSLASVEMKSHFAIMLISSKDFDFGFEFKNIQDSMLNWVGINSQKLDRDKEKLAIVLHTNFKWTQENLDADRDLITELALKELESLTGFKDEQPLYKACHRWLYGRTLEPLGQEYVFDAQHGLGACGDYMLGEDIEAAYTSSSKLAERIYKEHKVG